MTLPHLFSRRSAMAIAAGAAGAACCSRPSPQGPSRHAGADPGDPSGCWTRRPELPFAVQEIYPAAHAGRIHIAGGLLGENGRVTGVSDRHVAHDPSTGATAALAALPAPLHHPQLVDHAGRLYLLGGFSTQPGAVAWIMAVETMVYDDAGNVWSRLDAAPEPHAEAVSASIAGRIHIVGGRSPRGAANAAYGDHADTARHLVFDPAGNVWSRAAPALTARNSAAGALIDGLWHVAGGRTVGGGPTDAHEVYDAGEDRWRTAAPMPEGSGAGGNAAAALGGAIYVFGGEYFPQGGSVGGVHAEVWRYDPRADAWAPASPMPTPRHGLGAVALDGSIYTVGGATRPSGADTSAAIERFTTDC